MVQAVFLIIFIITLLVGGFAYFFPTQNGNGPLGFLMEGSGYNSVEELNNKKLQQLDKTINKGLNQVHQEMDDNALRQNKILDSIKSQEQLVHLDQTTDDLQRHTQNLIEDEHQKAQEQQQLIQQRIQDQEQRMQDQQNR